MQITLFLKMSSKCCYNNYHHKDLCHSQTKHVMSWGVMSCHVMSWDVMGCDVMSCHVMSCHVMSCQVMWCHVMSGHYCARFVAAIFKHSYVAWIPQRMDCYFWKLFRLCLEDMIDWSNISVMDVMMKSVNIDCIWMPLRGTNLWKF